MAHAKNFFIWGIVTLIFSAFVLMLIDGGVPDKSQLTEMVGQLKSLDKTTSKGGGLSAVHFSLTTDHRNFYYISKAGQIDEVWRALQQAGSSEVRLLFDSANTYSPPLESRFFHMAYEIAVEGNLVVSHSQAAQSWETNNFIGKALGYGCLLIGIMLIGVAFLKRRL